MFTSPDKSHFNHESTIRGFHEATKKIQGLTATNSQYRANSSLFESIKDNDKIVKQMIDRRI
jgi:hypothetical protein